MSKPKVMLTVDVEALPMRAESDHINTLIYGRKDGKEYGIGKMMDIADKHNIKMTFFVDFAECELYGDEILEVGRYIVSRGHDMQVSCHCDLLLKKFYGDSNINQNSDDDSIVNRRIINYVTNKYIECTSDKPVAFRNAEYNVEIGIIKSLKESGYRADFSYNCICSKELSDTPQFEYENGLLEFPVGILRNSESVNLNYSSIAPKNRKDFDDAICKYKTFLEKYFDYFGNDFIAPMIMNSWSFMQKNETTGYIDIPNDLTAEFFDCFIESMKEFVDFVSVTEAINSVDINKLKKVDFEAAIAECKIPYNDIVKNISNYVHKRIGDRNLVIWGKGRLEDIFYRTYNFIYDEFKLKCFISNDATINSVWRNKPVYKFEDVKISPQNDYVLILASSKFNEIRESLKSVGFTEFDDYFDIQNQSSEKKHSKKCHCPICGSESFDVNRSKKPNQCLTCNSLERNRTFLNFINDNVEYGLLNKKLLHISPSLIEKRLITTIGAIVTTMDIRPDLNTDIVADICNMPEIESETYDIVFASGVLECVYDTDLALNEMARILNNGGMAIYWAIDYGVLKSYDTDDASNCTYGKENLIKYRVGLYRLFGEVDFIKMLRKYFSEVQCFEKYDEVTNYSCKWYVCKK